MKKNFIIDTNVLLHDPYSIFKFEDNNVIIPIVVLEELDQFKRNIDELGRNSRQMGRILDELRQQGSLAQGVNISEGGTLKIDISGDENLLPKSLIGKHEDNLILATAYKYHKEYPEIPTIFVTKDINLRLKADALGVKAVDYESEGLPTQVKELDRGWSKIELKEEEFQEFKGKGWLQPKYNFPNYKMFTFINQNNHKQIAYGKLDSKGDKIIELQDYSNGILGVKPRNPEQYLAFDILLNPEIQLVVLLGKAGTGKTLLGVAAGLFLTIEKNLYQRLLVSRPVFPMGKEIGFLPGDIQEKMQPWMQPIFDNLDFIFQKRKVIIDKDTSKKGKCEKTFQYQEMLDLGIIQVEPLTYIRGRSIPDQYIVIDEAQNLTPHEVKTIITRAGVGTKIVFTGDPYQIDNPYLDINSNALSYLVHKLKGEKIFAHILLEKGERSPLAELAAEKL